MAATHLLKEEKAKLAV